MYNKTIQTGRITKDLVLKNTQNGTPVVSFTLAVNRRFTNQDGKREADFIPVVAWKKQAENLCKYLGKGSLITVDGHLQGRTYEDTNGKKVFVLEVIADDIIYLESANKHKDSNNTQANNNFQSTNDDPFGGGYGPIDLNDDFPF